MPLGSAKRDWAYKLLFINIVLWYGQISEDVEKTWSCLFRNQCLVKSYTVRVQEWLGDYKCR